MTMVDARPQITQLPIRELVPAMATNVCSDPGPDPTWYPDGWPPEKEPEEEPKPVKSIAGRAAKSARKGVIPDVFHCSYEGTFPGISVARSRASSICCSRRLPAYALVHEPCHGVDRRAVGRATWATSASS